ncbi:two-component system, OmpR family, sensor histidine kinase VanS [Halolactibacillus alkaliphilus]|uniref:sensor histidine kinase n=1 Tax=Halolactibacillus alkaliphilus TaxID=442899 RepID=UPI0008EF0BB9|nr:two-component system, OmpR family, sensor histidine kinase VanS [Halolactibacillus alkaliphilus]
MKNNEKINYKRRITSRITIQYLLLLAGLAVGFFLLSLLLETLIHSVVWQPENKLYVFMKFVRKYIVLFAGVPLLAGFIVITYGFIGKPLQYLDEVILASQQLACPTDRQIILSDDMKWVQDQMNQARETSLRNAQIAKEAEQRKNDLIVYLAHDLKTPLTSVIGYLTLLQDERQITEDLREKYLSISLNKAERLEDLINEFFEITRFNLSNIDLQLTRVNLTRLLEQLVFEFNPLLTDKGLQCNLNVNANVIIRCDANKMQRVFDNLLRNAVFYSFENSTIEIRAIQDDIKTNIIFKNHGDTISKDKLDRIFEQFYRIDTSRSTNSGGSGLGLAIAKEIVTLHKGSILATSENEIIEFCVTIPMS